MIVADPAAGLGVALRLHVATSGVAVGDVVQLRLLLETWAVREAAGSPTTPCSPTPPCCSTGWTPSPTPTASSTWTATSTPVWSASPGTCWSPR